MVAHRVELYPTKAHPTCIVGQVLVWSEDDEYRSRLIGAKSTGQLDLLIEKDSPYGLTLKFETGQEWEMAPGQRTFFFYGPGAIVHLVPDNRVDGETPVIYSYMKSEI